MRTLHIRSFPDAVCEEHGIMDVFPCPWPGCRNGHGEDSFQVRRYYTEESPRAYTRRQWHSPMGDDYYSWGSDHLPNWFSVPKTFWNEARRLKIIGHTVLPSLVYHYTSLEGFVGIVQSRSLWLSDYSYLNDKRELMHGVETIRKVIAEMLPMNADARVADLLGAWDRELAVPKHRVCVASFSSEGDSLSQWRAYGPIAIGISPYHLPIHAYQANLRPVEYDREAQNKLTTVYLNHMTQAYMADLSEGRLERIPDAYHRTDRHVELAAFFKDPAFRDEQEYRLAYIEDPVAFQSEELPVPPKRFRVHKSKLLPYVVSDELFPLEGQREPLEIKEVVLGPGTDELLERGICEFLASCEMPDVTVRMSTVPYRT